tara:strand:+ start:529 stop:1848 length:1320 start_codon:yes stop_codon:yes gene_type:complete
MPKNIEKNQKRLGAQWRNGKLIDNRGNVLVKAPSLLDAAENINNFMPVTGDIQAGLLGMQDLKNGNYGSAALNGLGLLPFVPALGGMIKSGKKLTDAERRAIPATKSVAEDSYKLQHTAPMKDETNSPLHALANTFGDDIYTPQAAQYYGDSGGRDAMDIASARLMQSFKGKPDEMVTMYRAAPRGVDNINNGDWVTINKEYAKRHGDNHLDGDFKILEKQVPARELFTDGNSLHEFGYDQSVKKLTEFELAHDVAQQNAAKSLDDGGLGLGKNNTAMERAQALGYKTDGYHGTNSDIKSFDNAKTAQGTHWFAENPEMANAYSRLGDEGGNVMPLMAKVDNPVDWNAYDNLGLYEYKGRGYDGGLLPAADGQTSGFVMEPNQLRSRFAAFDPARAHEADILGSADVGLLGLLGIGGAAGLGGVNYIKDKPKKKRSKKD